MDVEEVQKLSAQKIINSAAQWLAVQCYHQGQKCKHSTLNDLTIIVLSCFYLATFMIMLLVPFLQHVFLQLLILLFSTAWPNLAVNLARKGRKECHVRALASAS